jgi:hypothetical protein
MVKIPVTCLLLALAIASSAIPSSGQRTVTGVVIDVGGLPVENASVEAVPTGDGNNGAVADSHHWIKADNHGHFALPLAPGRYRIVAKRESEGYPDPTFVFNRDRSAVFPEVAVENSDISGVCVQFGSRGGFLYGTLRSQRDRSPVPHATVTISDAHNKGAYVQLFTDSRGQFKLAIPSKPVVVTAAAPGHTGGSFGNGQELTLLPGEYVSLVIELDQR